MVRIGTELAEDARWALATNDLLHESEPLDPGNETVQNVGSPRLGFQVKIKPSD